MNDELVLGWRSGDPTATTAVRNGLRALASGLLGTPDHGLPEPERSDPDVRRELAASVAREVMQRGGSSTDELMGLAVMVTARLVIQTCRDRRPPLASGPSAEGHLPPQLVVSVALAADSLSAHVRTMAERHLADCADCRKEADQVRRLLRGGFTTAAPRPLPVAGSTPVPTPIAPASPEAPGGARAGWNDGRIGLPAILESEPTQEVARPAPTPPHIPARPPAAKSPVRLQRARPRSEEGGLRTWWPVLAIAAVLGVLVALRQQESAQAERVPELTSIAIRTAPPIPDASTFPSNARSALLDLEKGDCRLAALRLRTARLQNPDRSDIALTEAGAWVCAGGGDEAAAALAEVERLVQSPEPELLWYRAQAALLQGDAALAREMLVRVRPLVDLERGRLIDGQLDRLRAITR